MVWIAAAVISVCVLIGIISMQSLGIRATALSITIITLCVLPILLTPSADVFHIGIAGPTPELRTFGAVLFLQALLLLLFKTWTPIPLLFAPFMLWVAIGTIFLWDQSDIVWAGVLQLLLGIVSFSVGKRTGVGFRLAGPEASILALLILVIVCAEIVACSLQLAGVHVNPMAPADAAILGNRTNGLANHPDTLGKILVFLMLLSLPLTRSPLARTRRRATLALFLSFLPLAMAQGRANIIAAIMVILVWALLLPREKRIGFREGLLAGAVLVGLGIAGVVLSRFDEDPTGGVRSEIANFAYGQIALRPLTGTGPNNYTTVAGPMTGSWIPVHNSFLLAAAELGVLGAILFFGAIAVLVIRAWSQRKQQESADAARAIVASVPAVLLIGLTGWGLMGTSVFALWLFTLGVQVGMMKQSNTGLAFTEIQEPTERSSSRHQSQPILASSKSLSRD